MSARRPWLFPLVPLYAAGVRWKNRRFDNHRSKGRLLQDPVVSVGSLSAGGAGKTPFVIALAGLLREIGYAPDVLSRGYGRSSREVLRVDPQGSVERFGDEPLLLARVLGCPVYVAAERYEAGRAAEAEGAQSGRGIHLLDDGLSHRRLARTVDIVLLTAEDLHDSLLPAGNLREPLEALARADIVVVRASEAAQVRPAIERLWRSVGPPVPVWTIERRLTLPSRVPSRPLVFSGIARPADFQAMLAAKSVRAAAHVRFRDHHRYTLRDVEGLCAKARATAADGFLTTAKDAVKLDASMRNKLQQTGPVAVADAAVTLHDREACAQDLRRLLRERTQLRAFLTGPERRP